MTMVDDRLVSGAAVLRLGPASMNDVRSSSRRRRARRRPTRFAGSRPLSVQRRIDASLTFKKVAASRVVRSRSRATGISLRLAALIGSTADQVSGSSPSQRAGFLRALTVKDNVGGPQT